MVARNAEDYYSIALRLATTPYVYEKTRYRLIRARADCPLYNTEKWVREWERALRILWETRHLLDQDVVEDGVAEMIRGGEGSNAKTRSFHAIVAGG